MTTILCFQCIGGTSFLFQEVLMSCATASFKWYMSHIVSITAGTFMTAALLFFIFSIAACVSDISIRLILMKIWLSSHISLKVVLRWNYTFFFFFFKGSVTDPQRFIFFHHFDFYSRGTLINSNRLANSWHPMLITFKIKDPEPFLYFN